MPSKKTTIFNILKEIGIFKEILEKILGILKVLGCILGYALLAFAYGCTSYTLNLASLNESLLECCISTGTIIAAIILFLAWLLVSLLCNTTNIREVIAAWTAPKKRKILIVSSIVIGVILIGYIVGNYVLDSTNFRIHNSILNTFMGVHLAIAGVACIGMILILIVGIVWILTYPFRCLVVNLVALNALTYMPTTEDDIERLNITDYLEFENYLIHLFHGEKASRVTVSYWLVDAIRDSIRTSLETYLNIYGYTDGRFAELSPYPVCTSVFLDLRVPEVSKPCYRSKGIEDLEYTLTDPIQTMAEHLKIAAESQKNKERSDYFRQTLNNLTQEEKEILRKYSEDNKR